MGDTDRSGYITVDNLRCVLGEEFDGVKVEQLIDEADLLQDGRVSYPEFVAYLRGDPLEAHGEAALKVIDSQLAAQATGSASFFRIIGCARGSAGVTSVTLGSVTLG